MKFTDGYWHMRPGTTPHFPIQIHDVEIEPDALTVYGATKRLSTRGDTLNLPLLTVRFSSPMPDVIRVKITHHKGRRPKQPAFELQPQPAPTVVIHDDAQAATLTSGRLTFNNRESGVELHNITTKELQKLIKIRKETVCGSDGKCLGVIYFLPKGIIENSQAAFEAAGKTLADLQTTQPYIGPPTTPGRLGNRIFIYGPWTSRWDLNLMKRTTITENTNFEFRVQFLNAFNQSIITIRGAGTDASGGFSPSASTFGQTRNAYRDFTVSGTNDPGGRLIEFQLRLNF